MTKPTYEQLANVSAQLREIALSTNITVIIPKSRPLTPAQQAAEDAWLADPNRPIDYLGLL